MAATCRPRCRAISGGRPRGRSHQQHDRRVDSASGASGIRARRDRSGVLLVTITEGRATLDKARDLRRGSDDLLEVVEQQERLLSPMSATMPSPASAPRPPSRRAPPRAPEGSPRARSRRPAGRTRRRRGTRREPPAELDDDAGLSDPAGSVIVTTRWSRDELDERARSWSRPSSAPPAREGCSAGSRTARPCPRAPPGPARRAVGRQPRRARTGARRSSA